MNKTPLLVIVMLACAANAFADAPPPEKVVAALQELRTELEYPGLTLDQAAANLKTPQEAFRFVRDEIVLVNYRGSYCGAEGALRTRAANATDKSMLLALLLQKMNVKVRMARADWPAGGAAHQAPGPKRPLASLDKLAALVRGEGAEGETAADRLTDEQLKQLRDEVAAGQKAVARVLAAAGRAQLLEGSPAPADVAPARTDNHWVWVQAKLDGTTWADLDPVFPDRPRPANVQAPYGFMPAGIKIRLEAGHAGQEQAESLLEVQRSCHDLMGYDVALSFFPAEGDLKAANEAQKVPRWKPVLVCGEKRLAGKEFAPAGGPGAAATETKSEPAGGGGGFGALLGGPKKPEPKPQAGGCDFLRLVIEINDNAQPKPHTTSLSRVIQFTGAGYDAEELVAVHRIILNPGIVPPRVAESRMVDEVLDAAALRRAAAEGGKATVPPPRGMSTRAAKIVNSMLFLKLLATPKDLKLAWQGPAVFVETYQLRRIGEERFFVTRLDTWQEAFAPQAGSSREQRAAWGLATAAAEAMLLKATSVNRNLLTAEKSLALAAKPVAGRLDETSLQQSVLDGGGVLLASADAPGSVWAIRPSGDLLGVYVDVHSGLSAKGAGTVARSEAAANAYGALCEGAMSTMGCPAGLLVTPLQMYFQELAKAYIKAASVLDKLATTIETGDDSHMAGDEADYFKNLDRHLTNALARGFVKGWAENAVGAGFTHVLGSGGKYPMTDRIIDGLIATDLSLPPEIPGFTPVVERAMDAVTIPPRE